MKVATSETDTALPSDEIHEENPEPNIAGEDKICNSTARKKVARSRTLALADEVLCGREKETFDIIKLVGQPDHNEGHKVISVWGMGGRGKTTLVRRIYRSQQLGGGSVLGPLHCVLLSQKYSLEIWLCSFRILFKKILPNQLESNRKAYL